ncbi:MAG: PAS domain-containing protein [Anaerolineales bacterium]|nr:PAS domain-containing protein [Anaerolineales bacterium]
MQSNPYAIHLIVAIALLVFLVVRTWRRRQVPGALALNLLLGGILIWAIGYAFEISVTRLELQVWFAKLEYVGILSAPVFWMIFARQYRQRADGFNWRFAALLAVIPLVLLALVWTNEAHWLVWRQVRQEQYGGLLFLVVEHGPAFWLVVVFAYVVLAAGMVELARALSGAPRLYREQTWVMLSGALAPWVANILYITGITPLPYLDLTVFAFTFTGTVASWGLFRYSLMEIVPIAREAVIDSMNEGVIVLDLQERIVDINPAARQLIALGDERVIGQPVAEALVRMPALVACFSLGDGAEIELPDGDGNMILDVQVTPVRDRRGRELGVQVVLRDITARKRAEELLRQAKEDAEAASRAKTLFLGNISHEFRTPLAVVMNYAELLQEMTESRGETEYSSRLETVRRAGERLLKMINDVLEISRLDSGKIEPLLEAFDVRKMVAYLSAAFYNSLEKKGNVLTTDIQVNGPVILDHEKVERVLSNLLDNANKFTENGSICLAAWRQEEAGQRWVVFEVADTGMGISAEELESIFETFEKGDASSTQYYSGAGLGLPICQRLCYIMGGTISVASTPGQGSLFTVRLPEATRSKFSHKMG